MALNTRLRESLVAVLGEAEVTPVLVICETDDVFAFADRPAILRSGRVGQ